MEAHPHQPAISAEEALERLKRGNDRFRDGTSRTAGLSRDQIARLSSGQSPYATILGCSDSRVAPEWIFDAGLGELFVVRVAGNVMSPEIAGSLQYAGSHLHTPLFVVLGHENCGAVQAALDSRNQGAVQLSRIQILVNSILPGLPEPDPAASPTVRLSQAVEANVRQTVAQIRAYPEVKARAAEALMRLVGAVYDVNTGIVRWLA